MRFIYKTLIKKEVTKMSNSTMNATLESAMNAVGENVGNHAINWIINKLNDQYGKALVLTGSVFTRYLENAYKRYNQVKTLVTGIEPRNIIGRNSIYIKVGISYQHSEYDTSSINKLLTISNNLLICGSGGAGKSMLMRYLFLDTVKRGDYVPVLLELRKINEKDSSENALMELIYKCMSDFDTELPREQFEYSLRLGKYVFFLDGFDEIKSALVDDAAEAIQKFAAKYPENAYIITSRPDRDFSALETFSQLETMDLTKKQAVALSKKFWPQDEKTIEFSNQLNRTLFEQHRDFAQNPLLLSMMFLTYMHNNSIPDHRAEFYEKCYNALYSMHDNHNKGTYKREFECINLNESTFKQLFSRFCFISYFDSEYEFTEDEIVDRLEKCILKLNLTGTNAKHYLNDLCKVVCLIVKEGNTYRFAHRSFQSYFAAVYAINLPDEKQKLLFDELLSAEIWFKKINYFTLLWQMERERFTLNALEPTLRIINQEISKREDNKLWLLKNVYFNMGLDTISESETVCVYFQSTNWTSIENEKQTNDYRIPNVVNLVRILSLTRVEEPCSKKDSKTLANLMSRLERQMLNVNDIDKVNGLNEKERQKVYQIFFNAVKISETITEIKDILNNIDTMRQSLDSANSVFDEL